MLTMLDPVLEALSDGSVIRRYVAAILELVAWLMLALGVLGIVVILKAAFNDALPAEATIAGVVWVLIFAAAIWAIAQAAFYHAREVRRLQGDRFIVIPIASIVMRLLGEQAAIWCVAFGVAGFLIALVAADYAAFLLNATSMLPGLPVGSAGGLLGALWVLGLSLGIGFAVLFAFYLSGETILVATDAANHLRQLVALATPAIELSPAAVTTVRLPETRSCPACQVPLAGPSAFCEHCGTKL